MTSREILPRTPAGVRVREGQGSAPVPRRVSKALDALEQRTIVRVADVHAEVYVESEKLDAIDALVDKAMIGHAFLHARANHLAGDDLILADELRFFTDASRLSKGHLIADFVDRVRCL